MPSLVQEKVDQAVGILQEQEVDLWLTFVRETSAGGDPVIPLIYGLDLTWQSALMLTRTGEHIAIVGAFEAEAARRTGAYSTVIPYHQSIRADLLQALERLDPRQIAVNYSLNDVHADGLTHGMYQLLLNLLDGTPYAGRLVSAEAIIAALRGRKTPEEITRIRKAVATTAKIYNETFEYAKPGLTERQVGEFMHRKLDEYKVGAAWEYEVCPAVNAGPDFAGGSRRADRYPHRARAYPALRFRRERERVLF